MPGKTSSVAAAALLMAFAAPLPAAAEQLMGEELKQFVNGKRVYLATPFGGEFPLYYKTDGTVDGSGKALGLGDLRGGHERALGRWREVHHLAVAKVLAVRVSHQGIADRCSHSTNVRKVHPCPCAVMQVQNKNRSIGGI